MRNIPALSGPLTIYFDFGFSILDRKTADAKKTGAQKCRPSRDLLTKLWPPHSSRCKGNSMLSRPPDHNRAANARDGQGE